MRQLLRLIAGRCETHDAASAFVIAELERDLGIALDAVAKHQATAPSFTEAHANPRLIDCGRRGCRERG